MELAIVSNVSTSTVQSSVLSFLYSVYRMIACTHRNINYDTHTLHISILVCTFKLTSMYCILQVCNLHIYYSHDHLSWFRYDKGQNDLVRKKREKRFYSCVRNVSGSCSIKVTIYYVSLCMNLAYLFYSNVFFQLFILNYWLLFVEFQFASFNTKHHAD